MTFSRIHEKIKHLQIMLKGIKSMYNSNWKTGRLLIKNIDKGKLIER